MGSGARPVPCEAEGTSTAELIGCPVDDWDIEVREVGSIVRDERCPKPPCESGDQKVGVVVSPPVSTPIRPSRRGRAPTGARRSGDEAPSSRRRRTRCGSRGAAWPSSTRPGRREIRAVELEEDPLLALERVIEAWTCLVPQAVYAETVERGLQAEYPNAHCPQPR
jgi:hypothetical protein